ncbi:MAG TPA: MFS transporter [Gaiellales bacterium]|jgi:EmrB/QacA subfamily drug resistance transporter
MDNTTSHSTSDRRRWLALAVIVAAQFMVVLDVAIVNVALPSIKTDLHFSQPNLQWVISAYAIFFGGLLLLGGRLGDLLGRRRLFIAGLAIFTASSLACGVSWSEGSLIAFRAVQGLGGALLAPAALSILITTFSEGRERNLALGIWGAASGSGGAAGVLLGGVLTSYLSWSWVFFVNVPIGVALVVATPWLLRESRSGATHRHFDVAGAVSVTSSLMLLVYAVTRTADSGWANGLTLALLAASAVLMAGFIAIELRSPHPLLPMRIFRMRTLAAANAIALLVGSIMFSQFFLQTLYMQDVLHYSPIQSGAAFVTMTLAILVFSNVAQMLVSRIGVRRVLTTGLVLDTVSLVLLTRLPVDGHYFTNLFPAYLIGGLGMALIFVPMTIAGLTGVSREDAGVASGLINTSRQIGGAVGLAAVSSIAASYAGHGRITAAVAASDLTRGFQVGFEVLTGITVVAALITVCFIASPRKAVAHDEVVVETLERVQEAA